jgi:predicted O-methyltransferase YrrM
MEDLRYLRAPVQLERIVEKTQAVEFPMASESLLGALLQTLAASKPGGRILELGTGTGISTAWLLSGMSEDATLVSVDTDERVQGIAAECLGDDGRLSLVISDGMEFLNKQATESFDLVFADAVPGKYEGCEHALAVVKPGGFYVIDDMLPQPNWPEGHAAKIPVLMDVLAGRTDFTLVPMVWTSGVVVAVRRA